MNDPMNPTVEDPPVWLVERRDASPRAVGWQWDAMHAAKELMARLDGGKNIDVSPIVHLAKMAEAKISELETRITELETSAE